MTEVSASRNEIVGASDRGLVLQIEGRDNVAPWSAVLDVHAVMALVDRTSDQRMAMLVLGIMVGADERVFIVGESERMWEPLVSTMPDFLPEIPSVEAWSVELAALGNALLYDRDWAQGENSD